MFRDLLIEIKGFKYQRTLKVLLRKQKVNTNIEFASEYFDSKTKKVLGFNDGLNNSLHEFLYRLNNLINEAPAWTTEYIDAECTNISICNPLSGSTYTELPDKLKHPI